MKLTKKEIKEYIDKIKAFNTKSNWWYQPIDFGQGLKTHSYKWSDEEFYSRKSFGLNKWHNYVKPFLPISLKDKVVLEIGSNAGLFLIESVKEGAKHAYGVEPSSKHGIQFANGFYEQSQLALEIASIIDNVDYSSKITIIDNEMHNVDLSNLNLDIVFAFNVLYWLSFSDETGDYENAKKLLESIIHNIAKHSTWFFIIGDEGTAKSRKQKNQNSYCTGVEETKPFLKDFDVVTEWIETNESDREVCVLVGKSKLKNECSHK